MAEQLAKALRLLQGPGTGVGQREEEREEAEFLAEVAHQLMTPVTSIKGAAKLLQEESGCEPLDPQQRAKLVNSMDRGITVLEALVNRLLHYGQLRTGRARLAPEIADVEALVRGCAAITEPTVTSRAQSLRLDVAGP